MVCCKHCCCVISIVRVLLTKGKKMKKTNNCVIFVCNNFFAVHVFIHIKLKCLCTALIVNGLTLDTDNKIIIAMKMLNDHLSGRSNILSFNQKCLPPLMTVLSAPYVISSKCYAIEIGQTD